MNKELIEIAASIVRLSPEEAQKYCKRIESINALYFWNPVRGGIAVIINEHGDKLAATSSISYEKHLQAFLEGRRN